MYEYLIEDSFGFVYYVLDCELLPGDLILDGPFFFCGEYK